jgi:hypothetical protein
MKELETGQEVICLMLRWNDTTTAWTSLGTIVFPQQTSGYILVRRLACDESMGLYTSTT